MQPNEAYDKPAVKTLLIKFSSFYFHSTTQFQPLNRCHHKSFQLFSTGIIYYISKHGCLKRKQKSGSISCTIFILIYPIFLYYLWAFKIIFSFRKLISIILRGCLLTTSNFILNHGKPFQLPFSYLSINSITPCNLNHVLKINMMIADFTLRRLQLTQIWFLCVCCHFLEENYRQRHVETAFQWIKIGHSSHIEITQISFQISETSSLKFM